jgi:hypothetical protein
VENTCWRALGGAAIDDIISHGKDPQRARWPRRLTVATIAAAVLAALIVEHLPRNAPSPSHPPRAAASPALAAPIKIRPARPDGIIGPTVPWAAGLRLPVSGHRPAWLWPATGRMAPIGGLPLAKSGYVFTRVTGGWAVQPGAATGPRCAGCGTRPWPVYFLADRARSATLVGAADRVAPAAESGAVWLTSHPVGPGPFGADPGGAVGFAREVSAIGKPLGPRLALPAGFVIDEGTNRGLLLVPAPPAHTATPVYELWNPVTSRVVRRFGAVLAASASRIAWTSGCAAQCLVQVLDLATGRMTRIALPAGSSAARGAFSPDGRLLALELSFGNGGDGGAVATQLEVAWVPGGRLTVVPGTWASSDALTGFGWPAADDSLVAELSFVTRVQVASWYPRGGQLAVADVRQEQRPNELVVG